MSAEPATGLNTMLAFTLACAYLHAHYCPKRAMPKTTDGVILLTSAPVFFDLKQFDHPDAFNKAFREAVAKLVDHLTATFATSEYVATHAIFDVQFDANFGDKDDEYLKTNTFTGIKLSGRLIAKRK